MPPEISELTLEQAPNTPIKIKDSEFKTNLLPMMMAMGGGGSSGDMMNNPMMMFVMMEAMKGNDD